MTFTVYGLRLRGDAEARYIGFTRKSPAERLKKHLVGQIFRASYRPLIPWVRANYDKIEAFPIAKCETELQARATESLAIAFCLALGHRLLNGAQVPPSHRQFSNNAQPTPLGAARGGGRDIGAASVAPLTLHGAALAGEVGL